MSPTLTVRQSINLYTRTHLPVSSSHHRFTHPFRFPSRRPCSRLNIRVPPGGRVRDLWHISYDETKHELLKHAPIRPSTHSFIQVPIASAENSSSNRSDTSGTYGQTYTLTHPFIDRSRHPSIHSAFKLHGVTVLHGCARIRIPPALGRI